MENESEQARIGQSLSVGKVKIYFTCFFSLRAGGTQTISVDKKGMIGDMSDNKKTLPCRLHFEGRGTPRSVVSNTQPATALKYYSNYC